MNAKSTSDGVKSKSLVRGIGIYAVGTFGTKILSFLVVPLYTYYVCTTDMGVYDLTISTINLLTPIVTLQISDAAYRWVISEECENREAYIRSTIQVLIINCLFALAVLLLINIHTSIPFFEYFCALLVLSQSQMTLQKLLRALKRQWLFVISGLVYTGVYLSLNIVQLCFMGMGVESLFQSACVAYSTSIIIIIALEPSLRMKVIEKPDVDLIRRMYKYSIPLVPNYLNWWIINSSDRYIVLFTLGASANGLLAVAHKFPTVLQSILSLFINSWQDMSVADDEEGVGKYYTKVFRVLYRISLSSLFVIVPLTKVFFFLVMSESYKGASDYVAFYYLGTVFQCFSSFYGVGYLRAAHTGKAFSTSVYGAVVNAVVNIALVNYIGVQAAAISTFIGFLVMFLMREKQNKDELGIVIEWREFLLLLLLGMVTCALSVGLGIKENAVIAFLGGNIFLFMNRKEFLMIYSRIVSGKRR